MRRIATLAFVGVLAASAGAGVARGDEDRGVAELRAGLPRCEPARRCLGIQLHVAAGAGGPIVSAGWLAAQLAEANRHFAPIGVGFTVIGVDTLPASAEHVATRRDRDDLAVGRLTGAAIHVFVVGRLDDLDAPGEIIRGVAWHARGDRRKYVLVSRVAPERVLAHELGHVFGLPHSRHAISIMNKTERARPPIEQRRFADEELAAMRPVVRRMLRDKMIAEVPECGYSGREC